MRPCASPSRQQRSVGLDDHPEHNTQDRNQKNDGPQDLEDTTRSRETSVETTHTPVGLIEQLQHLP